jgi:hypothetical protein
MIEAMTSVCQILSTTVAFSREGEELKKWLVEEAGLIEVGIEL